MVIILHPWEHPIGHSNHADRDFTLFPYDRQEQRVANYIYNTIGIGGGDDPIGYLISTLSIE